MPYKSKSQMRKFYAMEARGELPEGTAEEWAKHTPKIKSLPEHKKKAGQVVGFLSLLDKIASGGEPVKNSRWPYEQKRRIENLNRVINGPSHSGKTSPRIERLMYGTSRDGHLFSAGRIKKILSKLAFEKSALFGRKKLLPPPTKPGLVQRMLGLPGKHPRATLFLGGTGLGYWLGRRSNQQYSVPQDAYYQ